MKPKKPPPAKGLPGWMASYADMVTILMVFFILMYSMSVIDEDLFAAFIASFGAQNVIMDIGAGGELMIDFGQGLLPDNPPPQPTPPPAAPMDEGGEAGQFTGLTEGELLALMENSFMTYMAAHAPGLVAQVDDILLADPGAIQGEQAPIGIDIDEISGALVITFRDGVLFMPGRADLLPPALETLGLVAPALYQLALEGHDIVVEGHTDNVPMNTYRFPSNRHLSSGRADTVVEYLIQNHGFDPRVLRSQGRSEYFPIDTNDTPEGRANNRRIEIRVYANPEMLGQGVGFLIPLVADTP